MKKFALACVVVLVFLLGLELVARVFYTGKKIHDPLSGHLPNPKNFGILDELAKPLPDKKGLRVVITGGSVAYGWGASSDDKRFVNQLKPLLPMEVIGAGVPDFTALDEYAFYLHHLRKFQPDVVVMVTGFNDLWDMLRYQLAFTQDPRLAKTFQHRVVDTQQTGALAAALVKSIASEIYAGLYRHSRFFQWMADTLQDMGYRPIQNLAKFDDVRGKESLKELVDVIDSFHYLLKKNGVKLIVIIQPMRSLTHLPQSEFPISRWEAKLRSLHQEFLKPELNRLKQKNGVSIYDLNDSFVDDLAKSQSFIDFCHLNDEGNLKLAQAVRKIIVDETGAAKK